MITYARFVDLQQREILLSASQVASIQIRKSGPQPDCDQEELDLRSPQWFVRITDSTGEVYLLGPHDSEIDARRSQTHIAHQLWGNSLVHL